MWPWLSFPWGPAFPFPPGSELSFPDVLLFFSGSVFVALFGRTLNHNVCIIYFRLRLKVFKLLFNLVFPSWVTRTKRRWMPTKTSQINMQISPFLVSRVLFIEKWLAEWRDWWLAIAIWRQLLRKILKIFQKLIPRSNYGLLWILNLKFFPLVNQNDVDAFLKSILSVTLFLIQLLHGRPKRALFTGWANTFIDCRFSAKQKTYFPTKELQ